MPEERIGFIGTGIMGKPMAMNLLKAGYSLVVHNRTKSKASALLDAGAQWADTPALTASESDIVITCLPDTPDVEKVLLGKNGIIESSRSGLICIDMSTISPKSTQQIAAKLQTKKIILMDAPVSGGQIGAIEAKLSIMAGGPEEIYQKVLPVMQTLRKTITLCGPIGYGQITKLANQVMVIHTIMSIAEGLAFAKKAGLDLQTTWQVTTGGAAYSHSLKVLGKKIIEGDFAPAFMVDLQMKDLRLVMQYADMINQPLPGTALAKELLAVLQAKGRGRDGTQALFDVIMHLGSGS
ncbi:MAG: NAD(P)-dependent oxidoreductase [Phycisphaerae bacterium]